VRLHGRRRLHLHMSMSKEVGMLRLSLASALFLFGCYRSSSLAGDAVPAEGVDREQNGDSGDALLDGTDGTDLDEPGDGGREGPFELDALPLCDPSIISNVPWAGCGDGVREAWEECDDQNAVEGDRCTWDCLLGEGSGGVAGPSPWPLPRYCLIEAPRMVLPMESTRDPGIPYQPAFWWTGSEYRVIVMDHMSGGEYVRKLLLAGFDRGGAEARILFEKSLTSSTSPFVLVSVLRNGSSIELLIGYLHTESGTIFSRMSIDEDGNVLEEEEAIFHFQGIQLGIARTYSLGSKTVMTLSIDDFDPAHEYEDTGVLIDSSAPGSRVCRFGIDGPLGVYDTLKSFDQMQMAKGGDGGYLTTSLAESAAFPDGGFYTFLGIPAAADRIPSDTVLRPLCLWQPSRTSPTYYLHGTSIVPANGAYYVFFNCFYEDLDMVAYPFKPHVAKMNGRGEPYRVPTRVFPEGFLENHAEEQCSSFPYFYRYMQLFAAASAGTIGVLYVPWGEECVPGSTGWSPLFQTLDMDGMQVGAPCEGPPESATFDTAAMLPQVIGVAWDGEGYAVAALLEDGVYFWRYLPE
jgi:cysteine-rich repeat protein